MASKTPRFERRITRTPAPIDPLAGAEFGVVAQELERFSAQRQAELDEAAEQSGFEEGQLAGSEGEAATGSERTIRGRAFNRGVLVSHQAALQTDIRDSVARFELEHEREPEAFDAKVEGLLDGLMAEADPRLQAFIRQRAADYSGRAKSRILGRQQAELLKQAQADLKRGHEGLLEDATTAAFEADIAMVETRRQELNGLLADAIDGELTTEEAAAAVSVDFERQITSAEVVGEFDRLIRSQGIEAAQKSIDRWQDIKPSSVGLTAEDHLAVTRQLRAMRNGEISDMADRSAKETAQQRADHNARVDRIQGATSVLTDGFRLKPDDAKQVAEDLAIHTATGDAADIQAATELAHDFDVANAINDQVARFRRMPADKRAEELTTLEADMRDKGASEEERELLNALQKTSADVNRALETDPRGHLQRENLVEDEPLDLSSGEAFVESLASRDTRAASWLAGEPVGRLSAAEADRIAQLYEQSEIEQRVGYLAAITAGSGEDAEATLQQLNANDHTEMAMLGGFVLDGREQLARDVMLGQVALSTTPAIKPEVGDYQSAIDDIWAGASSELGGLLEQREQFLDAAFAKYADTKARHGDLTDDYRSKWMEQALEAVMPTANFNGRRVAIPAGHTEDSFDDWVDAWTPETFGQFLSDDDVWMATPGVTASGMLELMRDNGRLVELGNGRYGVKPVDPSTGLGKILTKDDGTPYTIHLPRPAQ